MYLRNAWSELGGTLRSFGGSSHFQREGELCFDSRYMFMSVYVVGGVVGLPCASALAVSLRGFVLYIISTRPVTCLSLVLLEKYVRGFFW